MISIDSNVCEDFRVGKCEIWCEGADEVMEFVEAARELGLRLPKYLFADLVDGVEEPMSLDDVRDKAKRVMGEYIADGMAFYSPQTIQNKAGWMNCRNWFVQRKRAEYQVDLADCSDLYCEALNPLDFDINDLF